MVYLWESGTLRNFFDTFHQGTEIDGRYGGVSDQFYEVTDDYDCTALNFHATIVECAE